MAVFDIGGRVTIRRNNPDPPDRRAISCIIEDDEGLRSLGRALVGKGAGSRRKANLKDSHSYQPLSLQLHSEYSSTYKWHEFTANVQQEVIKHPPMSSNGMKATFW